MSSQQIVKRIMHILRVIYSPDEARDIFRHLKNLMDVYSRDETIRSKRARYNDSVVLNEEDAILITYGDTLTREGEKPLKTLHRFLEDHIKDAITGVHILPFAPSSSDGGYSVIDYKQVDPRLGSWEDIRAIAKDYRVMADLVMNHISSQSKWFRHFLHGDKRYRDFFHWSYKRLEMPEVFRPREHPLFTPFETSEGTRYVWTTFSEDQIDLNFRNPVVLLKMIDIFLFYLSQGIEIVRLDAIGYVWKEPGTSCVNLAKTHQLVRLLRAILEYTAPYAVILTEANFPYKDNVAYFGEGHEANMVYNFALPPLVIDALAQEDASYIQEETRKIRQNLLFFNFLASHDGIGLLSARGILTPERFENLLHLTEGHNGYISYKTSHDTGRSPYELNISYYDAINDPNKKGDPLDVDRFMASQATMLLDKGIPGIYVHSLLGSRNDIRDAEETGIKRMINREVLCDKDVRQALGDPDSLRHRVLNSYLDLLRARRRSPLFHHKVKKEVVDSDKRLFVIARSDASERLIAVVNLSDDTLELETCRGRRDLISGDIFDGTVTPYGVYFLE